MGVANLLMIEDDGTLSFGDHTLAEKAKVEDFQYKGDLIKCKTYKPMTKLEKNGMFVYESVPGTSVYHFAETESGVEFEVEGSEDAQVTIGLEEDASYEVVVDGVNAGTMKTNMGGKLSFNAELGDSGAKKVSIKKA